MQDVKASVPARHAERALRPKRSCLRPCSEIAGLFSTAMCCRSTSPASQSLSVGV